MQLTPELLLKAYSIGVFPMAESRHDPELHWIDPEVRGILPLERFHVPRRLKRTIRRKGFEVTCDTAFHDVVLSCAGPRNDRSDTWINPTIENLTTQLFEMGFAHSIEVRTDGALAGGLYGIALGACFFGESMFSHERDASKIAFANLVMRLRRAGYLLLDTQFTTPHLNRFGVIDISRDEYRERLASAVRRQAEFPTAPIPHDEFVDFLDACV
jgi:leucyl/phenylalanyl-tRNA--protein transferase